MHNRRFCFSGEVQNHSDPKGFTSFPKSHAPKTVVNHPSGALGKANRFFQAQLLNGNISIFGLLAPLHCVDSPVDERQVSSSVCELGSFQTRRRRSASPPHLHMSVHVSLLVNVAKTAQMRFRATDGNHSSFGPATFPSI